MIATSEVLLNYKASDGQIKYLMLKNRKLNHVSKMCLLSCTVTAIFLE